MKILLFAFLFSTAACNQFGSQTSEFAALDGVSPQVALPDAHNDPTSAGQLPPTEEIQNPDSTVDPAPVVDQEPAPVVDQEPAPVVDQDPAPVVDQDPAPVVDQDPAPVVDQGPAPVVDQEPTPVVDQDPAPVVDQSPPPSTPLESTPKVCEVIDNQGEVRVLNGRGLIGSIYDGILANGTNSFSQIQQKGTLLDEKIYFANLNISRAMNPGFKKDDGSYILNSQGTKLVTDYGLLFETSLALSDEDEEGFYQLSIIAEDGIVIEDSSQQKELISADHSTPAKYSCAKSNGKLLEIKMERGKSLPINIKYFQGKKNRHAMIFMWRKVRNLDGTLMPETKDKDLSEHCGQAGNHYFFDLTSGEHPTKDYQDLFNPAERKIPWKIIKHQNYLLPESISNTICQEQD